jgi:hypothetical protein
VREREKEREREKGEWFDSVFFSLYDPLGNLNGWRAREIEGDRQTWRFADFGTAHFSV